MDKKLENLSIEELGSMNMLSRRAMNICLAHHFHTVNDIVMFHKSNYSFLVLKNCGGRTEQEFLKICKEVENTPREELEKHLAAIESFRKKISLLDKEELEKLNEFINQQLTKLSTRGRNGIFRLFKEKQPTPIDIIEAVISDTFNFNSINLIGKTTEVELYHFRDNIKGFINSLTSN